MGEGTAASCKNSSTEAATVQEENNIMMRTTKIRHVFELCVLCSESVHSIWDGFRAETAAAAKDDDDDGGGHTMIKNVELYMFLIFSYSIVCSLQSNSSSSCCRRSNWLRSNPAVGRCPTLHVAYQLLIQNRSSLLSDKKPAYYVDEFI